MQKSLISALCLCSAITSTTADFTPADVPLFIAGLLHGFIEKEDLKELQICLQHTDVLAQEVVTAVDYF